MARARRGGTKKIDFVEWSGQLGIEMAMASNVGAIITVITSLQAATLLRTRGEILASIDGPVDNDACSVACGITVVTEEQLAVGLTAVPDPAVDLDADWLWHGFIPLKAQAGTGVGASLNVVGVAHRLTIDSKAMRKLRPTNSLVFAAKNSGLAGTPAVDLVVAVRCLKGI